MNKEMHGLLLIIIIGIFAILAFPTVLQARKTRIESETKIQVERLFTHDRLSVGYSVFLGVIINSQGSTLILETVMPEYGEPFRHVVYYPWRGHPITFYGEEGMFLYRCVVVDVGYNDKKGYFIDVEFNRVKRRDV